MRSRPLDRRSLTLPLLVALVAALPLPANSAPRNQITVQGRILDEAGRPILSTWVVVEGSRRAGVPNNADGSYSMTVPGGTLGEMAQRPVTLRVRARQDGWRFGLRSGDPELAIEMSVVESGTSLPRFRVRSSDPAVAATIANAAVLESTPHAVLQIDFIGVRGVQDRAEEARFESVQEVVLSGTSEQLATRSTPEWLEPLPERPTEPPSREPAGPLTSGSHSESAPPREPDRAAATQYPKNREGSDRGRRRGTSPIEVREPPANPAKDPEPVAPLPDPGLLVIARRLDRPPMPGESSVLRAPSPPVAPEARAVRRSEPRVIKIDPWSNPAAGAVERPVTPSPPSAGPCACRVRGTVEVRWDRALEERIRVEVFLEDRPAVSAWVELFMGSPRAFELDVPCGSHLIGFRTYSKQRFTLDSFKPAVDCRPGGYQEVRLVLEPLSRRRFW